MDGIKEDVITILLNLKKVRFKVSTDEPQIATLKIKGPAHSNGQKYKNSRPGGGVE